MRKAQLLSWKVEAQLLLRFIVLVSALSWRVATFRRHGLCASHPRLRSSHSTRNESS